MTDRSETAFPVAVTGWGVLTPLGGDPLGADPTALFAALEAGQRSVQPASAPAGVGESRIGAFDPTSYANVRGMRAYNHATRLAICAAQLALRDGKLEQPLPEELGVVMASTFGHMTTLIEYDRGLATEGPARTNPALMPMALLSAPGAALALSFGAKAFSVTVSDSGASALDALGIAARLLAARRARYCLVAASAALSYELTLSAMRANLLSTADEFRVYDRRSRGSVFGEAGVAILLERAEHARARGARVHGWLCGQASRLATHPERVEAALLSACRAGLARAGVEAAEIGLVSSGAGGLPAADRAEARALARLLEGAAPPIVALKANLGDTLDASGLLQALLGLGALQTGKAPPIAGLHEPELPGLSYAMTSVAIDQSRPVLVTSTAPTGACSALVLSRSLPS